MESASVEVNVRPVRQSSVMRDRLDVVRGRRWRVPISGARATLISWRDELRRGREEWGGERGVNEDSPGRESDGWNADSLVPSIKTHCHSCFQVFCAQTDIASSDDIYPETDAYPRDTSDDGLTTV